VFLILVGVNSLLALFFPSVDSFGELSSYPHWLLLHYKLSSLFLPQKSKKIISKVLFPCTSGCLFFAWFYLIGLILRPLRMYINIQKFLPLNARLQHHYLHLHVFPKLILDRAFVHKIRRAYLKKAESLLLAIIIRVNMALCLLSCVAGSICSFSSSGVID